MDISVVLPCLFTAVIGILGYFVKRLVNSLDRLERDFSGERQRVSEEIARVRDEYVKHEHFSRFETAIDYKLTKIYDLLVSQK